MATPDPNLVTIMRGLGALAEHASVYDVKIAARNALDPTRHNLDEALRLLALEIPLPKGWQHDMQREHKRMAGLIEGGNVLLELGANPLPDLDELLHSHRDWASALLWSLGKHWKDPRWWHTRNENPLHSLARGNSDLVRGNHLCSPWVARAPEWAKQGRSGDGHTPLHLVWTMEGLAGVAMTWGQGRKMQWMAFEVLEEAIAYSGWLVEVAGASWDDTNIQGERAGDVLLRAWDSGLGDWMPNIYGTAWIEDVVEQQRKIEQAKRWRELLMREAARQDTEGP